MISVFIEGEPKAQPRPRAFARKMGNLIRAGVYDAGTADGWKSCVMRAMAKFANREISGPVRIDLTFFMPRPKYMLTKKFPDHEVWHTKKPDRDNLEKAVLDALKDIKVLGDDCLVVDGRLRKFIVRKEGGRIGAHLKLTPLAEIESFVTVEDETFQKPRKLFEMPCPGCGEYLSCSC